MLTYTIDGSTVRAMFAQRRPLTVRSRAGPRRPNGPEAPMRSIHPSTNSPCSICRSHLPRRPAPSTLRGAAACPSIEPRTASRCSATTRCKPFHATGTSECSQGQRRAEGLEPRHLPDVDRGDRIAASAQRVFRRRSSPVVDAPRRRPRLQSTDDWSEPVRPSEPRGRGRDRRPGRASFLLTLGRVAVASLASGPAFGEPGLGGWSALVWTGIRNVQLARCLRRFVAAKHTTQIVGLRHRGRHGSLTEQIAPCERGPG